MLVQSVLAGVGRVGRRVRRVIHALLVVRRGPDGELADVLPAVAPADRPTDALVEEWLRLELDPAPSEEGEDLASELGAVLDAVRAVADDGAGLAAAVRTVAGELAADGAPGSAAERADAARLLRWLADGRFTFLGYRHVPTGRPGRSPRWASGCCGPPGPRPTAGTASRRTSGRWSWSPGPTRRAWCCARTGRTRWCSRRETANTGSSGCSPRPHCTSRCWTRR